MWGRRAVLVGLLGVAAFAVCVGRLFLYPRSQPTAHGAAVNSAIRNVLLISIDTCRADHLSCYGFKRPTSPNIDAVARDGALFKMALTPVPITTPAHSSILTGTYPPKHGVHLNNYDHLAPLSPDGQAGNLSIAKTLHEAGYQTAAFVGAIPLDARFGLNQGFETYDGCFTDESKSGWSHRSGEEVNRPALGWLDNHVKKVSAQNDPEHKPFFLFLHYYDLHFPREPHPPYNISYADDTYSGELAYVDNCIGHVLDRLRKLGVYDNTLVIITADHGESLGEHGEETHTYFIYQSTLRVPLVIRVPGCGKGIQVGENVSLVDIVPTVLDLLGLKTPPRVDGENLRAVLEGKPPPPENQRAPRAIYAESLQATTYECSPLHSIVEGPWKYILAPRPELYDLSKDPDELTNLLAKESGAKDVEIARRLRRRLETMFENLERAAPKRASSAPRKLLDPDAAKRLESLGYVGGGATMHVSALDLKREDPKDFLPTYKRLIDAWAHLDDDASRRQQLKKQLREIAAERPGLIELQKLLADIAMKDGRPADAEVYYTTIVALLSQLNGPTKQPPGGWGELAESQRLLGFALGSQGKTAEAAAHYAEALRLEPNLPLTMNNLAWIRATSEYPELRNGPEAVRLGERASELSGHRDVNFLDTLAAAYAEAGRFAEAAQTARQAQALATEQNMKKLADSIQARIRLYEAHKPFREITGPPTKSSTQR
jgi:arylsulfatase A-like enzyme